MAIPYLIGLMEAEGQARKAIFDGSIIDVEYDVVEDDQRLLPPPARDGEQG